MAKVPKLQEIPKVCSQINSSSAGFSFTCVRFHSARENADKMKIVVVIHSFHCVGCTVLSRATGWTVCLTLWDAFKTSGGGIGWPDWQRDRPMTAQFGLSGAKVRGLIISPLGYSVSKDALYDFLWHNCPTQLVSFLWLFE